MQCYSVKPLIKHMTLQLNQIFLDDLIRRLKERGGGGVEVLIDQFESGPSLSIIGT